MSSRMRQGSWLSLPMTPLLATAAIKLTFIATCEIRKLGPSFPFGSASVGPGRRGSNRDRSSDAGVRLVADQLEIGRGEREDVAHLGVEPHLRQRPRLALQLQARLLLVVLVEVHVPEAVDELSRLQATHLGHH